MCEIINERDTKQNLMRLPSYLLRFIATVLFKLRLSYFWFDSDGFRKYFAFFFHILTVQLNEKWVLQMVQHTLAHFGCLLASLKIISVV